jgi:hypothetical protein
LHSADAVDVADADGDADGHGEWHWDGDGDAVGHAVTDGHADPLGQCDEHRLRVAVSNGDALSDADTDTDRDR